MAAAGAAGAGAAGLGDARPSSAASSSASSRSRCKRGARRPLQLVVEETGKSLELALGEVDAAVEMGFFVAGEGRRLYGRTTTSAMPNRTVMATRRPVGVAGADRLVQHAAAELRVEGLSRQSSAAMLQC